jgi:hypothetical protein
MVWNKLNHKIWPMQRFWTPTGSHIPIYQWQIWPCRKEHPQQTRTNRRCMQRVTPRGETYGPVTLYGLQFRILATWSLWVHYSSSWNVYRQGRLTERDADSKSTMLTDVYIFSKVSDKRRHIPCSQDAYCSERGPEIRDKSFLPRWRKCKQPYMHSSSWR